MNDNLVSPFLNFKSLIFCVALWTTGIPTLAQEIEIIGNDGKEVEIKSRVDGEIIPLAEASVHAQKIGTGKGLTVKGPDGQPMPLPTEDVRSVQIQRSVTTQNFLGNQTVEEKGIVIVVGTDGQRREYELVEMDDSDEDDIGGLKRMLADQVPEVKRSWKIGIVTEPAPEMIRSQLGLAENTGLLVRQIQPGSPAEIGGLKKFDVLLYAEDQELSTVKDLTTVAEEIGQQGGVITLTVIRGGEEIPIQVQPEERDYTAMPIQRMPMEMLEMNDMGPGILFGRDNGNDGGKIRMQEMMQHLEQMKEKFQNMDALIREGFPMQLEMPQLGQ